MPSSQQKLESLFSATFNATPDGMVKAPGRVCIIGGHIDTHGGFVLPCALNSATISMFRVRGDKSIRVHSLQYPGYIDEFNLEQKIAHCEQPWANYVRGVFHTTQDYGFELTRGLDLLISSKIPPDSGLASSAALAVSVAGAISKALNLPLDKRSLALIAQKAENDFLGKRCGIMDQLTATMAKKDQLLLIDCEDFDVKPIPFLHELSIVVFHSCIRNKISRDEYNKIRSDCESAAATMGVRSLRHATLELLQSFESRMGDAVFRRARHIVTEIERAKLFSQALKDTKPKKLYKLMRESHASMKNDYQSTIPQIDALVDYCQEILDGEVGARMTGGGFGGPIVALCHQDQVKLLIEGVTQKYQQYYKLIPPARAFRPDDGMKISWLNKK